MDIELAANARPPCLLKMCQAAAIQRSDDIRLGNDARQLSVFVNHRHGM